MEIWKPIKGYEGLYEISNLGNVKCVEHKCKGRFGNLRTVKEHMMKCVLNKTNGYYYVSLSKGDRGKTFAVHRLVANAFIPNPNNLQILNHIDENKQNNVIDNLEWCTSLYNNTYNDVHKKRKRYSHTWEYEKDNIIKKAKNLNNEIISFENSYNDVKIRNVITELLSQKNHGK